MKELRGVKEIEEYFQNLLTNAPNGKYQLARIYGMAKRENDQIQEKRTLEDTLKLSQGGYIVETTVVSETIAIVEIELNSREKKETTFYPIVNGKLCYECADSFDRALVIALSEKYGVRSLAPAIVSILEMEKFETNDNDIRTNES
ncbi:hypothetical protein NDS46_31590 (plasmid) [Paenibacillus thiaminolyticus]|uniref:hypothetical protein n=1 Tax=Paenibacillus thiaminolyticus TaxID=49283 RepID=UPI00232BAB25|nr:hypothetical protein [Paenibacillus thiaminolyticus]WCF11502.1 hypothetical protein NDS46_31590 [Paenibacillus thiaminolyticus]